MRLRRFRRLVILCLLALAPPAAFAWGNEGHQIIADVASDRLTPAARENLRELIGNRDLQSISTWADEIRSSRPETRSWHYVDIPWSARKYQAADCPDQNCVVAKIAHFTQILGDPAQSLDARREALKFVVHLVADVHQPFHALLEARGGNDIPVSFFGSDQCGRSECNLHWVWDIGLIQHAGMGGDRYADRLERMIARDHLRAGPRSPEIWADESFRLAKSAWVTAGTGIGQAYYLRERPVLNRQLALAGLRLARILNEQLGGRGGETSLRR